MLTKALDKIRFASIIREPNVLSMYPDTDNVDGIPKVVCSLFSPIRSKLLNYHATVENNDLFDDVTFDTSVETYSCGESEFCDPNHGHWESAIHCKQKIEKTSR